MAELGKRPTQRFRASGKTLRKTLWKMQEEITYRHKIRISSVNFKTKWHLALVPDFNALSSAICSLNLFLSFYETVIAYAIQHLS